MIKKFFLTAAAAAALAAGCLPAQADVQFESKHQEECAIWLCLPVGFAPADASVYSASIRFPRRRSSHPARTRTTGMTRDLI